MAEQLQINPALRSVIETYLNDVEQWAEPDDVHWMACGAALKWAEAQSDLDRADRETLAAIDTVVRLIQTERKQKREGAA